MIFPGIALYYGNTSILCIVIMSGPEAYWYYNIHSSSGSLVFKHLVYIGLCRVDFCHSLLRYVCLGQLGLIGLFLPANKRRMRLLTRIY